MNQVIPGILSLQVPIFLLAAVGGAFAPEISKLGAR